MLTGICFACRNPINWNGRYVEAEIRHNYKHGGSRESRRRFHPACLETFKAEGGRPWNPETVYDVLSEELITQGSE